MKLKKRSILAHSVGGIIGIWSGSLTMLGFWEFVWLVTPHSYTDCSGAPCSTSEFFVPIISATIGGLVGGMVGNSIVQRLSGRPIHIQYMLLSGLIGAIVWPIIGLLWFMTLFLIVSPVKGAIEFIVVSTFILTLLGMLVGFVSVLIQSVTDQIK